MSWIVWAVIYITCFFLTYVLVMRTPKKIAFLATIQPPQIIKILVLCFFFWWLIALVLLFMWIWFSLFRRKSP